VMEAPLEGEPVGRRKSGVNRIGNAMGKKGRYFAPGHWFSVMGTFSPSERITYTI
jgi:hypothetical protein